ncbi:MAG: type II toxin-antitoxin system VapC family toxin [Oscillatoriales cyanobacterium SM2_2_1]|nr:type II toxin-antitoxin system VapC family toxin [Oscillatoriales cyanobacterium SM2_2_1]
MTYQYLLDTNIVSDLVRHPQGKVFQQIAVVREESICTSIVVACELQFGGVKRGSMRLMKRVALILERLPIVPLASPSEQHYAAIRQRLEQSGTPIGPNDLLIAAHAFALNLTLVTANTREFERVPDLRLANWLG